MITVVYLPNPFKPSSRILKPFTPDEVKTLADLKEHFKIHNPADFIWAINGHHIEDSRLDTAELRAADYVAIVPKIRGGGGGGGKNVLGVVAALALVAFTGGAGGGLLGGFLGSQGGMLGLGLALYLGGSLLMGNQKTPTIDAPKYDGAFEGGHGWSVDNIRNKPGSPLPVTFGSIRTSGQLLQRRLYGGMHAGKWTQFLQLLLAAGEGQLDSITDIKVNDIPIGSISGASYEVKLGTNNQTAISSVVSQIAEQLTFSSELPMSTTEWVTKAMSTPGTRITLEFVAPAGIYAVVMQTGANVGVSMWIRGQYREVGASTWVKMWPYYPNGERPLASFNSRKPLYFKQDFTPPDPTKLYEFRIQNYTWKYYDDTEWHGAYPTMPDNYQVTLNWLSLTSRTNRALTFPGTAIVALSLPATENLSGGMPKVSWTQTRANIYAWNPTAGAYQQKPATNLAWMIYDIIHACRLQYNIQTSANQYVVYGEPAANIDYDTFNEWATYCATEAEGVARCVGNLLLDSAEQMWPAIQKIATSARGFIIQQAGAFKPVWDAPKTVSQIFTSGNIINGSVKGGFLSEKERATAIEASFLNEDNGFERDTLFVPSDDYNPMGLDNPTQIYFPGLTSSDVVYRACKHILRRNKYLRRTISFQADIDSIVAEIGDVIGVQSDITDWGVGGRIMGATTTKVVIDQAVSLSPEGSYTLLVRAGDGTLTRKAVDAVAEAITTTELNFTGDPWSSAPVRYELYAFGVTELETKPFTITGISRNGDLQATIEGIEYVAGVYSDDTDFPVIDYTTANAAINTLTVNTDTDTGRLMLSWSVPEDRDYGGAWVYIDGKPYGFIVADQHDITIDMPPGTYGVTVLPIDGNGRGGTAVEQEVTLGQLTVAAVSGITLTSAVRQQPDGTNLIYIDGAFTIPTLATSVLIEIGEGSAPSSWKTVQDSRVAAVQYGPVEPGTLYTLKFTARNRYAVADAVEEYVTTAGDTTVPAAPAVTASGYLKVIKVDVELVDPPSDLAGFEIWKNTEENTGTATLAGYTAAVDGVASFVDQAPSYLTEMYYWAKSVDSWGNKSAFSESSLPTHVSQILTGDITANQIIGKYFTTAEDVGAEVDGVKFTADGIEMWRAGIREVLIPSTGDPVFNGTITALAGYIGECVIADGGLRSADFVSQHRGWNISKYGNAEFNNLRARGAIETAVFRKDEISVVGGKTLIRPAAVVEDYDYAAYLDEVAEASFEAYWAQLDELLDETIALPAFMPPADYDEFYATELDYWMQLNEVLVTGVFATVVTEADFSSATQQAALAAHWAQLDELLDESVSVPTFPYSTFAAYEQIEIDGWMQLNDMLDLDVFEPAIGANDTRLYLDYAADFAAGDVVRLKNETNDYWAVIASVGADYVDLSQRSGAIFDITPGQAVVNYGKAGSGGILLDGQSPLIDLFSHAGEPWNGTDLLVRQGNLNGWGGINTDVYGLAIGTPESDYILAIPGQGIFLNAKIQISGGAGIANLTDAGAAALADDLDGIGDGATYKRTTVNEKTGAGRAYAGLDASNRLVTAVIPTTAVSPSGSGLYMGSNYMGFYNSGWKTYMDNAGNFALVGSGTHGLSWNAGTGVLTVNGDITVQDGAITSAKITTGQIVGKDIRTATNAGNGTVSGLKLTSSGLEAWNGATRTVFIQSTGAASFSGVVSCGSGSSLAGFTATATDLTAGATTTAIGISTDTAKLAFWAGSETPSSAPFRVSHAGSVVMTSGFISGMVIDSDQLTVGSTGASDIVKLDGANKRIGWLSTSIGTRHAMITMSGFHAHYSYSGVTTNAYMAPGTGATASDAPVYVVMQSNSRYGVSTDGRVYAEGGYYPTSDERCKSEIEDVSVLNSLRQIRVKKYHLDDYKIAKIRHEKELLGNLKSNNVIASKSAFPSEPEIENYNPCKSIGVIAQDFNKAFGIGNNNEETYNLTDAIGVALRAIQELAEIVDDLKAENAELRAALKLPEKQKKQANSIEFTAEDIEKAADSHVKAAYENLIQIIAQ